MCGIVGFVQNTPLLNEQLLLRMRETLVHRGPDGAGLNCWDAHGKTCGEGSFPVAGFGHRRLSIIDLSEAGHQPMSNEDGTVWITYNGEFYNFGDYRAELEGQGHVFRSRCDTETILHLYESHGMEETLRRINGMFAFGIYDSRKKQLVLARDRVGKKPLYYMVLPDGGVMFASEIQALLESRLVDTSRIDAAALVQYWTYGYVTGGSTVFQQIKQLLPGHYAIWRDGQFSLREYWDCPFGNEPVSDRSLDSFADELDALLRDAIRMRLVSDVPVGLFLSGGIDSSLIAALAARVAGGKTETYSIGFPQQAFNEAPHASAVAQHLHLANHQMTVTEDLSLYFERIARRFAGPFGDSSSIPTYFVCKMAREKVTVVLTGDAGDELFAGYGRYAHSLLLWGNVKQKRIFWNQMSLGAKIRARRMWVMRGRERRLLFNMPISGAWARRILTERVWDEIGAGNPHADRERWGARCQGADLLSQLQYMDVKTYLPDDILAKVDRMSMAHSLECRCPLLDYRIVEFAAKLPWRAKIDERGRQKVILRHLLSRYVPPSLTERPKMGFGVPWAHWCQGPLGDELRHKWLAQRNGFQRPDLAAALFPRDKIGSEFLQWCAYTSLLFFETIQRPED